MTVGDYAKEHGVSTDIVRHRAETGKRPEARQDPSRRWMIPVEVVSLESAA